MKKRLFTPEDKIAPGLYMKYWDSIVEKYNCENLMSNKLKQYREVRTGAIIAALWTKTTGSKHFVSFSSIEPHDVEIYTLESTQLNGIDSYRLVKLPIQLTRCSLSSSESVVEQIKKKNRSGLSGVTLIVHIHAEDGDTIDLREIAMSVQSMDPIFPIEIALVAPLPSDTAEAQKFGQVLLGGADTPRGYTRTSEVSLNDKEAFFVEPSVMRSKKGTGQAITLDSEFSFMLP